MESMSNRASTRLRPGWPSGADQDAEVIDLTERAHRFAPDEPVVDRRRSSWVSGMPTVSVVIPTLNEERNLCHVLPRIPAWVDEVLIIDGRSTDGTISEAKRLLPDVRVVEEPGAGKGRALFTGMRAAEGDIVVALIHDEATVKYYFPERDHIRLQPANGRMAPILVRAADLRATTILGVVCGIYRRI